MGIVLNKLCAWNRCEARMSEVRFGGSAERGSLKFTKYDCANLPNIKIWQKKKEVQRIEGIKEQTLNASKDLKD